MGVKNRTTGGYVYEKNEECVNNGDRNSQKRRNSEYYRAKNVGLEVFWEEKIDEEIQYRSRHHKRKTID